MTQEQFIGQLSNWDGHRRLLWHALNETTGSIIEMGVGKGSTPQLHKFSEFHSRPLFSYEYDFEWYKKFKNMNTFLHDIEWVDNNWDMVNETHESCGVVFIDHSPGERRKIDINLFANKAQIVVAHDTEPNADHGYQMRDEFKKFKYIIEDKSFDAWTTCGSNFIDVTKFGGTYDYKPITPVTRTGI